MTRFLLPSVLLLGGLASSASAESVSRCPAGTRPMRTADASMPWACVLGGEKYRAGVDCPRGFKPVTTLEPDDPFKCAKKGIELRAPRALCPPGHRSVPTSEPGKDHECEKIQTGFMRGPRCPKGTRPVRTPGQLRAYKCFPDEKAKELEPSAEPKFPRLPKKPGKKRRPVRQSRRKVPDAKGRCPKGTMKVKTENPFEPWQCVKLQKGPEKSPRFKRLSKTGEMTFLYPGKWHLTDAWDDEVPSVYMLFDTGRDGRPVSMSVTRQRRGSKSYQPMKKMMANEKEWHGAKESARTTVGGLEAVFMSVPKESDTAFVKVPDGYFVLSYSAPPEAYERYGVYYRGLLKSFEFLGLPGGGKPEKKRASK